MYLGCGGPDSRLALSGSNLAPLGHLMEEHRDHYVEEGDEPLWKDILEMMIHRIRNKAAVAETAVDAFLSLNELCQVPEVSPQLWKMGTLRRVVSQPCRSCLFNNDSSSDEETHSLLTSKTPVFSPAHPVLYK